MDVLFKVLPEFSRRAKTLAKKYKSFVSDYNKLLDRLAANPYQGTDLGESVYKTRIPIVSKGKGKSGGARVLTYNVHKINPERIIIVLMSIYDKNEMENVSDSYIKAILKEAKDHNF